jgi:hypothetical protein
MFYAIHMSQSPVPRERVSLDLKLGRLIEARATGWAVLAVPVIVGLVILALKFGVTLR